MRNIWAWQPERPLLVEYWTLVGGGGLLWATVVMSPWIICLINRLKIFLHYYTSIVAAGVTIWYCCPFITTVCVWKQALNIIEPKVQTMVLVNTALPYVLVPPPPRLFHLSVQCLASVLETPGDIFNWAMFKIFLSRVLPLGLLILKCLPL